MHIRRFLTLLLPVVLGAAALTAAAGVAAPPAAAGMRHRVRHRPVRQSSRRDPRRGAGLRDRSPGRRDHLRGHRGLQLDLDSTPSGVYKVRVSDPQGSSSPPTSGDSPSFDDAYLIGYT